MQSWFSGARFAPGTIPIPPNDDMIVSATAPGDTSKAWFDTVTKTAYYHTGTRWESIMPIPYHGFHEFTVNNSQTMFPGAVCPNAQTGVVVERLDIAMLFANIPSTGYVFTLHATQQNWNVQTLLTTPLITTGGLLQFGVGAEATDERGRMRLSFTRTGAPNESEYTSTVWVRRYRK